MSNINRSLSESHILEYQQAFNTFDDKTTGLVSTKQLGNLLRHLGMNPTKEELQVQLIQISNLHSNKLGTYTFRLSHGGGGGVIITTIFFTIYNTISTEKVCPDT